MKLNQMSMRSGFSITKVAVAFSILATLFLNTACDESDVVAGVIIGGVIGGVIAGADDDHHHPRPPRCRGGYETECHTWYDYRGRRHRECREVWDSCRYRHRRHTAMVNATRSSVEVQPAGTVTPQTIVAAQKLQTGYEAAELFLEAMGQARLGDVSALARVGLQKEDLKQMAQLEMPSQDSIQSMAVQMNIEQHQAENILNEFLKETREQMSDISSMAWQTCLAGGKWKTPQAAICLKTSWHGCSPETGATACVPSR